MDGRRQCHWCASTIDVAARRCPHCHGWRLDIYEGRVICHASAILAGLVLAFGMWIRLWAVEGGAFSVGIFLGSFSGWVVVALYAVFAIHYVRVCRALGTWWWV